MTLLRQPRMHDDEFLARVRQLPCLFPLCNRVPVEAAHLRRGAIFDLGITESGSAKPHDALVVPLCALHHRLGEGAEHRIGSKSFWEAAHLDPTHTALRLYIAHRRIKDDIQALQAMRSIILEERFNALT
jgi:hypothetical protein